MIAGKNRTITINYICLCLLFGISFSACKTIPVYNEKPTEQKKSLSLEDAKRLFDAPDAFPQSNGITQQFSEITVYGYMMLRDGLKKVEGQ